MQTCKICTVAVLVQGQTKRKSGIAALTAAGAARLGRYRAECQQPATKWRGVDA